MALLKFDSGNSRGPDRLGRALAFALMFAALVTANPLAVGSAASREYQVKAVFLFNFTEFVDWPDAAFAAPGDPLVIGILGDDPFDGYLDDTVRGEKRGGHPLMVQRFRAVTEVGPCHILFVSGSESARLGPIFARLKGRSILTVGDSEAFARSGGMVRFLTVDHKIRLRINLQAARDAGLVLSSKLLRPAEIVADSAD